MVPYVWQWSIGLSVAVGGGRSLPVHSWAGSAIGDRRRARTPDRPTARPDHHRLPIMARQGSCCSSRRLKIVPVSIFKPDAFVRYCFSPTNRDWKFAPTTCTPLTRVRALHFSHFSPAPDCNIFTVFGSRYPLRISSTSSGLLLWLIIKEFPVSLMKINKRTEP